MNSNDYDPAMRYEGLARTAFDCGKRGGPNGIAYQEFYNNFVPDLNEKAIMALKEIIKAMLKKVGTDAKKDLQDLLASFDNASEMEQTTGIDLINYIIRICEDEPE